MNIFIFILSIIAMFFWGKLLFQNERKIKKTKNKIKEMDRELSSKNYLEMIVLKSQTIIDDNIMFDGKFYRYVNHDAKLLTTGFRIKDGLLKNKYIIRFDKLTILTMRNRYDKFYRS